MKGIKNIFKLRFWGNHSKTIVLCQNNDGVTRFLDKRMNDLFDYRRFEVNGLIEEEIVILREREKNKFILIESSTGKRISDIWFDEIYI